MKRKAQIRRKTRETDVSVSLVIDGRGLAKVSTGIGFLDHMLSSLAKHGLFDLEVKAKGDLNVDIHHTNEDIGLVLGEALKKALGDKQGIRRFGEGRVPLDEALVEVVLDLSGRPHFEWKDLRGVGQPALLPQEGRYTLDDVEHLLKAFVNQSGTTLHVRVLAGKDFHHTMEATFKAFAKALDQATQIDPRVKGIPSTKGKLG